MKKWFLFLLIILSCLGWCEELSSQNITKPNILGPMTGLQVNSYNGNLVCERTDLYIPGQGLDIDLTFTYNSSKTAIDDGFGNGWTFPCNIRYVLSGSDVIIRREDGRKDLFTFNGIDFDAPLGFFDTLTQYMPNMYRLRAKNGLTYFFDDPVSQRITCMVDRYGNTLTMTYSVQEIATLTDASGRVINFTWTAGHLTKITDPNFIPVREINIAYDSNGNLVTVTDPLGQTTQYSYNYARLMRGVTDKRGTTCAITYNSSFAVSTITSPLTYQTITYDAFNRKTTLRERVGNGVRITSYTYSVAGNVTMIDNPCCSGGLNLQYQYDADRNIIQFTDGNGNIYIYTYDSNGNRLTETDPLGGLQTWVYEPVFNRVTSYTDKNGNVTTNTYDANGNPIQVNHPEGVVETYTYDSKGNLTGSTDGNGNVHNYTYDAHGNLLQANLPIGSETYTYDGVGNALTVTDPNGNTTTNAYDVLDRVSQKTDPLGFITTFAYDANDNVLTVTDPLGNVITSTYDVLNRQTIVARPIGNTTFTYDDLDNVISSTDPKGNVTSLEYNVQNLVSKETNAVGDDMTFTYDANGNRISMTDFRGNTYTYTYDGLNRITQENAPLGQTVQYGYDPNSNVTSYTDGNGNVTTYTYDGLNRQDTETDPVGNRSQAFDFNSNLVSITDANGNTSVVVYDGNDRPVNATDAMGFVTTITYDNHGNVLTVTDPNSNTLTTTYDSRHQVLTTTNGAGETTSFTYDGARNPLSISFPNGNMVTYAYDANYRVTSTTDGVGVLKTFSWDSNDNLLSTTDGNGNAVSHTYDGLNRVVSSTDALGEVIGHSYDANSNLLQTTDREGNPTSYEYDALNRLTKVTDALGNEVLSGYDTNSNLTSQNDDNGNITTYTYDGVNRVTTETYADGTTKQFTYDPEDNMLSRTDNNGAVTSYTYDARYLVTQRNYPGSNDDNFSYDAGKRMTSASNNDATINFTYDTANRKLTEVLNGKTTAFAYDIPNRKCTLTYPGGRVIVEEYDQRARMLSVDEGMTTIASCAYDLGDRLTSKTLDNGVTSTVTHNANDWVISLVHANGGTTVAGFNYAYDKEGSKSYEEKTHQTGRSEAYSYDVLYQLTNLDRGILVGGTIPSPIQSDTFNYDGVNNRTTTVEAGINKTYTSNAMNEYTSIIGGGTINPVHDNNGNMMSYGSTSYAYDTENRLTEVDAGATATYKYDPFSRRIQRATASDTVNYYYDSWHVIEERDISDATQATYVYGREMDELITMDQSGQTHYYHTNALGSIIAMTDAAGNTLEYYEYNAYGSPLFFDGSYNSIGGTAITNPYLFTGRRLDEETGLYYYRTRYYDPGNGRFLQRDHKGIWEDASNLGNGYGYVGNSPIDWIDPFGFDRKKRGPQLGKNLTVSAFLDKRVDPRYRGRLLRAIKKGISMGGRVGRLFKRYFTSTKVLNFRFKIYLKYALRDKGNIGWGFPTVKQAIKKFAQLKKCRTAETVGQYLAFNYQGRVYKNAWIPGKKGRSRGTIVDLDIRLSAPSGKGKTQRLEDDFLWTLYHELLHLAYTRHIVENVKTDASIKNNRTSLGHETTVRYYTFLERVQMRAGPTQAELSAESGIGSFAAVAYLNEALTESIKKGRSLIYKGDIEWIYRQYNRNPKGWKKISKRWKK